MMLWFVALPLTTLAEITALGFTGPIFVTIGAALFLGEDVRLRRWLAVIVGFIGAMIIIRPGFSALHLGVICILVSTPIFSASNLISKALARTDSASTIVIWQNIVIVVCAAPLAIWFWQTPSWVDLLWFIAAGAAGTHGPYLPAARLPACRHHAAAADRLSVADLEHAAWATSCSSSRPTSGPSSAPR